MGKIVLKYPDLYKLNPKIDVFLNDKKIVEIERGQEKEITISENGILMFKGSIRKTKLNVKENCDYSISLGWDSFTGKLVTIIDSSTDTEVNSNLGETKNKQQKRLYIMIGFYSLLFIIAIIGISNSLGLFSGGTSKFLNAPMESCPNVTLKQGLNLLNNTLYGELNYEVKKGKSISGETKTYLYMSDIYTTLEKNSQGQVYLGNISWDRYSNKVVGNTGIYTSLLCGGAN